MADKKKEFSELLKRVQSNDSTLLELDLSSKVCEFSLRPILLLVANVACRDWRRSKRSNFLKLLHRIFI